ncbi:MAG TPA: SGNH/GDSL hydrolase family protein [Acidothermaceae bacterium]|jgi:lysophospholipase L1-like esterase|nr:SGNH/GDSL hydrolase family protein [Acidothermaceae bacterium]
MKRTGAVLAALLCVGVAGCSSSHASNAASSTTKAPSAAQTTALPAAAATTAAPSAAPTAPSAAASDQGKSIVVIGHSGATGYESDEGTVDASARQNAADGRENSWATGTNPAVDSIYLRLAAKSPEYTGHQFNLAADGATVDDMMSQASYLAQVKPAPAVVFVQGGDNDMKCDGTDAQNYAPFQANFTALLQSIAKLAPNASIYVMSMTISAASYADLVSGLPDVKAENADGSPCAPFDANLNKSATGIAYQQDVIDHYDNAMATACAGIPSCHYDKGAMQRLTVAPADLTSDGNHLNATGLRKYADLVWSTFFSGS